MRFTTAYSLIILGGALGLISSLSAQSGSDTYGMPVRVPTTHSGPAFSTPNNATAGTAGAGTSQPGGSSTSDSASSGTGSSGGNGSGSTAGPRDNTVSDDSAVRGKPADITTAIARERVIDTGDKGVEIDKATKTTKPSDKTFTPGLLDTVSDISKVSAQKDQGAVAKDEASHSKPKPAASEKDKDDSQKKN